jgi:hypothetical protein
LRDTSGDVKARHCRSDLRGPSETAHPRVNPVPRSSGAPTGRSLTVTLIGRMPTVTLTGKILASPAAIAAAGGLMLFATYGAFDHTSDLFPRSVLAPLV